MVVIPLGTSSGKPTLRRNVSALAVRREGEWLLFDCGEGAQMQIARAGLNTSRLAAIFITHLHGDHFNGASGLLSTMGLDRRVRELVMIGPRGIREYLDTLAKLRILFINYPLDLREFSSMSETTVVYETPNYVVSARPLDHRIFALGYRIEERPRPGRFNLEKARELGIPEGPLYGRLQSGQDVQLEDGRIIHPSDVLGPPRPGKAIAYCTDTRPCEAAIELARGVDLLIHEATYTHDLAGEAHEYGHSTAAEAARIAREAGARRLLITHFSTRYHDPTELLDEARAFFPDTVLAEELMEIAV
ncbi:MAG TPA: ribonuclease Z [Blastocatellia bacterium]|jgi:ribonuclease Z|nr:ribonuclease Z [Blastocatellia bacterium]